MSELKSFIVLYDGKFIRAYKESEADKVIAELEDSHKMEVGQLLIEIAELKDKLRHYPMMAALIENDNKEINKLKDLNHALMLDALRDRDRIRHDKYKRCLTMANVYHLQMMLTCSNSESILFKRACRRHQKYLELAEKFKEAK